VSDIARSMDLVGIPAELLRGDLADRCC